MLGETVGELLDPRLVAHRVFERLTRFERVEWANLCRAIGQKGIDARRPADNRGARTLKHGIGFAGQAALVEIPLREPPRRQSPLFLPSGSGSSRRF